MLICGDQQDPFFYGEPGTYLDWLAIYKKKFASDDAPRVVYFNAKNFTHPFPSTCVIEVLCGVKEADLHNGA